MYPEYKICTKCKENKHYTDFYWRKIGIKLKSECKVCAIKDKKWYKKKNICKCGNEKLASSEVCQQCRSATNVTIGEVRKRYKNSKLVNVHSFIRWRARKYKSLFDKCCLCGYDKHYELCHIKAIYSFEDSATLDDINHISNIAPLCPNCHWEFDNGLIPEEHLQRSIRDLNP